MNMRSSIASFLPTTVCHSEQSEESLLSACERDPSLSFRMTNFEKHLNPVGDWAWIHYLLKD